MKLKVEKPGLVELDAARVHGTFDTKVVNRLIRSHEKAMKVQMDAARDAAQRDIDQNALLADPGLVVVDPQRATALAARLQKGSRGAGCRGTADGRAG